MISAVREMDWPLYRQQKSSSRLDASPNLLFPRNLQKMNSKMTKAWLSAALWAGWVQMCAGRGQDTHLYWETVEPLRTSIKQVDLAIVILSQTADFNALFLFSSLFSWCSVAKMGLGLNQGGCNPNFLFQTRPAI